jgi:hypothetical protein
LLILECDSPALAADRLNLGSAFAQLVRDDLAKLLLKDKTIELVQTSSSVRLLDQFARAFEKHGCFRAILIVGHSDAKRLQLTHDASYEWRAVGEWLKPFGPELIFLAACEAGSSEAIRALFGPLRRTLRDIYGSPVNLYGTQAAVLAVLIGELLLTGEIDDENSIAARCVNYVSTGGQIYRWNRDDTGPGSEVAARTWDGLASLLDRGPWDLQQRLSEFIAGRRGR